jgi:hypothetical protein
MNFKLKSNMRRNTLKAIFIVLVAALIIAACRPDIASTSPDDGASDVKGHSEISADFSTSIDTASLQFSVENNSFPVPGTVRVEKNPVSDNDVAIFTPDKNSLFVAGKTYTATIKAGVVNPDGGSKMKSDYSWNFTIETDPPLLESVSPDNGQSICEGSPEVVLKFSENIGEVSFKINMEHSSPVFSEDRKRVSIRINHVNAGQTCRFVLYGFSDTAGNYTEMNKVIELRAVKPQ